MLFSDRTPTRHNSHNMVCMCVSSVSTTYLSCRLTKNSHKYKLTRKHTSCRLSPPQLPLSLCDWKLTASSSHTHTHTHHLHVTGHQQPLGELGTGQHVVFLLFLTLKADVLLTSLYREKGRRRGEGLQSLVKHCTSIETANEVGGCAKWCYMATINTVSSKLWSQQ